MEMLSNKILETKTSVAQQNVPLDEAADNKAAFEISISKEGFSSKLSFEGIATQAINEILSEMFRWSVVIVIIREVSEILCKLL